MTTSLPREVLARIRKLAQLAADLRRGENFQITRLTFLRVCARNLPWRIASYNIWHKKPGSASSMARAILSTEADEKISLTSK
jgi:hypothetical protein